ncbi:Uncharacterised protein [Mycobacteroides abscessus]|nr:Uncharacterised protein [Mycobacteroides abscessus]
MRRRPPGPTAAPGSSAADRGTPRSSHSVTATGSTLIQKTQRHEIASMRMPPSSGPTSDAVLVHAVQEPIARACRSPSNVEMIMASELGTSRAPATPWRPRATTRTRPSGASAHATDVTANPTSPIAMMRRRPWTSDSDPARRMSAPSVIM